MLGIPINEEHCEQTNVYLLYLIKEIDTDDNYYQQDGATSHIRR